jgi:hypothetical protein
MMMAVPAGLGYLVSCPALSLSGCLTWVALPSPARVAGVVMTSVVYPGFSF